MTTILSIPLMVFFNDLRSACRHPGDMLASVIFFVMITTLVPLGLGPDQALLVQIAPAIIWIAVMLASLPQMDRLFTREARDGVLEQMLVSPAPMPLLMLAKALAAWVIIILPLMLAAPVLALMLGLTFTGLWAIGIFLGLGGLCLILIGAMAAGLTLGSRRSGIFIALIVLPLAMPVLIFGVLATTAILTGGDAKGHLMLLTAIALILLVLAPPVSAAAIRFAEE
jgi:heme exporter protein B